MIDPATDSTLVLLLIFSESKKGEIPAVLLRSLFKMSPKSQKYPKQIDLFNASPGLSEIKKGQSHEKVRRLK